MSGAPAREPLRLDGFDPIRRIFFARAPSGARWFIPFDRYRACRERARALGKRADELLATDLDGVVPAEDNWPRG